MMNTCLKKMKTLTIIDAQYTHYNKNPNRPAAQSRAAKYIAQENTQRQTVSNGCLDIFDNITDVVCNF